MGKYKVLKSIAHNLGHSFTSLMNYYGNDYVMGHLLTLARETGLSELKLDFIRKTVEPEELNVPPISKSVNNYFERFPSLVQKSGSNLQYISSAKMNISYDLNISKPFYVNANLRESPYRCYVEIIDDRGKVYTAEFKGWWFPEKTPIKILPTIRRLLLILTVLLLALVTLFWGIWRYFFR